MPRKPKVPGAPVDPRGGPRSGTPGRRYPQRSDLAAQPVRTATGQAYGQAGQQAAAQRAVPLAQTPPPGAMAAAPAPAGGGAPLPHAPFDRPTEFPDEPLTAGIANGAGPGPEALGLGGADQDMAAFRAYLPTLELLSSLPNASSATRNFVRRIRGALGP